MSRSINFSISMPIAIKEALDTYCEEWHITRSRFIRDLIEKYLATMEEKPVTFWREKS